MAADWESEEEAEEEPSDQEVGDCLPQEEDDEDEDEDEDEERQQEDEAACPEQLTGCCCLEEADGEAADADEPEEQRDTGLEPGPAVGFLGCSHKDSAGVAVWVDSASGELCASNQAHRPAHLEARLPDLDGGEPIRRLVPARSSRLVLGTLGRPGSAAGLAWRFGWGDPEAVHSDKVRYTLPFVGRCRHVCQGFGGRFSHKGRLHFSVDFDMPVGTPVRACRAGVVVAVRNDSTVGGNSRKYASMANYAEILHRDGTVGTYLHFRCGGVAVKPGRKVRVGQLLGYCGLTGFTSRPHLHFHVKRYGNYLIGSSWNTVPFRWRADMGFGGSKGLLCVAGKWYKNKDGKARVVRDPRARKAKPK